MATARRTRYVDVEFTELEAHALLMAVKNMTEVGDDAPGPSDQAANRAAAKITTVLRRLPRPTAPAEARAVVRKEP